ncbi:Fic family protein [Pelagibacterium luteolum]|uniref:protein adenylyltransferase n=1 Tax=Pelagibacterium luteolum TaxID=440168 RepID=A0A1G7YSP7_9HYPH|nr:Fic family protein [Pelagibacterium luteolum]SDG99553.1 Fic/DOC family protein [Pelagibacterium luteolum]
MSDPYLYPGTTVLINHFNIRDQAKLDSKERRETLKTLKGLYDNPVKGEFGLAHLLEIHRRIFAPVYPFAGEIRRIDMVKAEEKLGGGSVEYAPFHLARLQAEHHLKQLNGRDWSGLRDLSRPQDMAAFASMIVDLWKIHPFREGNTRTTMTFMHQFAAAKGFALDRELIRANAEYVRHALVVGTHGETHYLTRILTDARQREHAREQGQARMEAQSRTDIGQAERAVLLPGRTLAPAVPKAELQERLAASESATEAMKRLVTTAKTVFADYRPVVEIIQNAALNGEIGNRQVISDLRDAPERFGPLTGRDAILASRQEREAHRKAIAAQPSLRGFAESYLKIVHGIRQTMLQHRHDEVRRASVEIPRPSVELMSALDRGDVLSPDLKVELRQTTSAFERRFGDDLAALRSGKNLGPLATRHSVDEKQLEEARGVLNSLDRAQAQERSRAQLRSLDRHGPTR